jgi:hypothetical protein
VQRNARTVGARIAMRCRADDGQARSMRTLAARGMEYRLAPGPSGVRMIATPVHALCRSRGARGRAGRTLSGRDR